MQKSRFSWCQFSLVLLIALHFSQVQASENISPKQFLFQQVLTGEANFRDDMVKQALYRLELIAPDDPEVISAGIRLALRQGNLKLANQKLAKLNNVAPGSEVYHSAKINIMLAQPQGKEKLQQAKLMAVAGQLIPAKNLYDSLFQGPPPTLALAAEYWSMVSRIPGQQDIAIQKLQGVYRDLVANKVINTSMNSHTWMGSLKSTLARLFDAKGEKALTDANLQSAEHMFQQATEYDGTDYMALVGLGKVAFARKDYVASEEFFKKANSVDPSGNMAVWGLIKIYKLQSPEKALAFLANLPPSKQDQYLALKNALQSGVYVDEAGKLEANKHLRAALEKYRKAYLLNANDPWAAYHVANVMYQLGQHNEANALFANFVVKRSNDPATIYAYALYLSGTNQKQSALTYLKQLPQKLWTKQLRTLAASMEKDLASAREQAVLSQAKKMRAAGDFSAANAYLLKQPSSVTIRLQLADWALEDNKYDLGLTYYREVKAIDPPNADAALGEIEALVGAGQLKDARRLLVAESYRVGRLNLSMQRRVARAWRSVGDLDKANQIVQRLKRLALKAPPNQDTAWVFRDAGELEQQLHDPKQARADYAQAMVKSGITSVYPEHNNNYTFLTRNKQQDDWLKRGIRSDAADLYRQQEIRVTLQHDNWSLAGTPGISNLTIKDDILQADMPLYDGRLYFRGDWVGANAGSFVTTNGSYFNAFGTCTSGCVDGVSQTTTGYSAGMGWQNDRWAADIGETPIGFDVVNFLGGLSYSGNFNHVGWTLAASQRPLVNSLLSFAGATDPNTGIVWGGVVATGPSLSLSYDRGGSYGLWGYLEANQLTGTNVASNQRVRLMEGYYYKIINEENRRASIGINNMLWHYQKNLDGYSLGQGGYYSPQHYVSFAVPVDYRRRTDNWSYEVGASVSWSYATIADSVLYPAPSIVPSPYIEKNTLITGGPSSAFGYTALAMAERRLGPYFSIGGVINIQQTRDYTPSQMSVYLRYIPEGWMGDLDMPIRPLIPYAYLR